MTDKLTAEQRAIVEKSRNAGRFPLSPGEGYGVELLKIVDAIAPKSETLLPCPFCGWEAKEFGEGRVKCSNGDGVLRCPNSALVYTREQWQRRAN